MALTGNIDGAASIQAQWGPDEAPAAGQWKTWVFFPNSGALRNQYTPLPALGYPMCLSACDMAPGRERPSGRGIETSADGLSFHRL